VPGQTGFAPKTQKNKRKIKPNNIGGTR